MSNPLLSIADLSPLGAASLCRSADPSMLAQMIVHLGLNHPAVDTLLGHLSRAVYRVAEEATEPLGQDGVYAAMKVAGAIDLEPLLCEEYWDADDVAAALSQWSTLCFEEGLFKLESLLPKIDDPLLHRGVEMVVRGADPCWVEWGLRIVPWYDLHPHDPERIVRGIAAIQTGRLYEESEE